MSSKIEITTLRVRVELMPVERSGINIIHELFSNLNIFFVLKQTQDKLFDTLSSNSGFITYSSLS